MSKKNNNTPFQIDEVLEKVTFKRDGQEAVDTWDVFDKIFKNLDSVSNFAWINNSSGSLMGYIFDVQYSQQTRCTVKLVEEFDGVGFQLTEHETSNIIYDRFISKTCFKKPNHIAGFFSCARIEESLNLRKGKRFKPFK